METRNGASGWVPHRYAFVNLPDILPSIVYDITNADASVFVSAGKDIPGITGQKLYDSRMLNERLEGNEYLVPVLYAMAKKIAAAQKAALAKGDTLVIVETFRPLDTQLLVAKQLEALSDADSEVRRGISTAPWGIGWFIANQVSTHQKGCAMDVTLAKLKTVRRYRSGAYVYSRASLYEPYEMPTPIHELSNRAVSLAKPVNSRSATAWKAVAARSHHERAGAQAAAVLHRRGPVPPGVGMVAFQRSRGQRGHRQPLHDHGVPGGRLSDRRLPLIGGGAGFRSCFTMKFP